MALSGTAHLNHSVDRVIGALTDEEFQKKAASDLGGTVVSHTVSGDVAGAFTLTVERSAPTDRVPDVLKKFIGSAVTFTQVDEYSAPGPDGSRTAQTKISVKGAPISVSGSQTLRPTEQGSDLELSGDVASSIPFVGGKIASFAEPLIGKVMDRQAASINSWLSAH